MRKAFSLSEVAIVIVVIAVLVSAAVQSSRLIIKSRLSTAQNLTESSIVNQLDGLVIWLETSLENSFDNFDLDDGSVITTWRDRNPNAAKKNNATSSGSNRPKFYSNIFSSAIPAVRFDGTNDFMNFDAGKLANSPYTIFIVEQRRSSAVDKYFISTSSSGTNLNAGYRLNNSLSFEHSATRTDFSVPNYDSTKPITRISTFIFNDEIGARYWENGGDDPDASNNSQTTNLSSITSAKIGSSISGSKYYNGDIAEIIIFNRNLKTTERKAVDDYLEKKYRK